MDIKLFFSRLFTHTSRQRRMGSGLLAVTVAAAVIVGLTSFGMARLYHGSTSYKAAVQSASLGQDLLASTVDRVRATSYADLDSQSLVMSPLGDSGYYETVIVGDEATGRDNNITRTVTVQLFYGNELAPRYTATVERTKYAALEHNLYQDCGANVDGPMTSAASYEEFALKKDSVKFTGQQVGDSQRPVYLDANGEVQPVSFYYRGQYNTLAKKVLTYTGSKIDFVNKDWLISNAAIADQRYDSQLGYIRYTNGTVFAWAKGLSSQAAGTRIVVDKPLPFKTLQAYSADSNQGDEASYNRLLWWLPGSNMTKDTFILNAAQAGKADSFTVFWIGHFDTSGRWADLNVSDSANQTITVTVTDARTGKTTVLTNGCSGVFTKGSVYTATITAHSGWVAGRLNSTSGSINNTVNITASDAVIGRKDFVYTANSTWVCPSYVTRIRVGCIGGGAGGCNIVGYNGSEGSYAPYSTSYGSGDYYYVRSGDGGASYFTAPDGSVLLSAGGGIGMEMWAHGRLDSTGWNPSGPYVRSGNGGSPNGVGGYVALERSIGNDAGAAFDSYFNIISGPYGRRGGAWGADHEGCWRFVGTGGSGGRNSAYLDVVPGYVYRIYVGAGGAGVGSTDAAGYGPGSDGAVYLSYGYGV